MAEVLEVGNAELHLASDRNTTGFLLYEFRSRETPVFFPPIRIKKSLWDRLLPWRANGPWLVDPAGGRHNPTSLPNDLSDLVPEARRYDPRRSRMTLSELESIEIEDLFESVRSLPEERDTDSSLVGVQGEIQGKGKRAKRRTGTPRGASNSSRPTSGSSEPEAPLEGVRFLTVSEVAIIMRVSKMTVYRLIRSGELDAVRIGRSYRIPEQAVIQYLRASSMGILY
jgi:excisionase family DNA binding protein